MSYSCLCLPNYSCYSSTDPGGMEGWVGLGGCLPRQLSWPSYYYSFTDPGGMEGWGGLGGCLLRQLSWPSYYYSFTDPGGMEGWVGLGGCLPRQFSWPSHYSQFYLQSEWAIPAFVFPTIAATHLPTPEGWTAELAWVAVYRDSLPAHHTTNRAQCRATATLNRH